MAERILVIDDNELLGTLVATVLRRRGFEVIRAADGRSGLKAMHDEQPDLVILDVGLPDVDGFTLVGLLHDAGDAPVLMVTGRALPDDVVRGLEAGADDYLAKPFHNEELVARVQALLRRRPLTASASASASDDVIVDGSLRVDLGAASVQLDGREIAMTPIELGLLAALMRQPGQVLSADQLLDLVWSDPSGASPDRVKFAVYRLRRKLGWEAEGSPLEALRGFGYRYRTPG